MIVTRTRNTTLATLVLALATGCATSGYEVLDTEGHRVDNRVLMQRPVGPDSGEDAAIEAQKRQIATIPMEGYDTPMLLLHSDLPAYPRDVQAEGIQGVVELLFTIDLDGSVKDPEVVASPDPRLSEVCVAAILKWRFQPLTKKGVPTRQRARQQFPFRL